jgi:glutaminase
VGGGIISAARGKFGIAVFGPALDGHGNSVGGVKMLEFLSEQMDLNMF